MRLPARLACIGVALVAVAQLSGCATSTVVTATVPAVTALPDRCNASVIDRGGSVPADYQEIGRIESHIQRNFFLGGVTLLDDAYRELRTKACGLGGDRVRVDDFVESAAAEMTHVHVWATVFRRTSGPVR